MATSRKIPNEADTARELAALRERDIEIRARTQLLMQASAMLSDSLDYESTLRRVVELAVPTLADWCTVAVIGEDGAMRRIAVVHRDAAMNELAQAYERDYPPSRHRESGFTQATQTRTSTLHEHVTDEMLRAGAQDEAHLRLLQALGCASCIIAPMVVRGEVVGALSLMMSDTSRRFDRDDVAIAEELARRAAVTVDNARLYREAKQREAEKRRQAEQRLDLLIDSIRDYAVFMLTPEGRVATWNPGAHRIKGYTADEIVGKHFSTFYPEEDVRGGKCEFELAEAAKHGRFEDLGWRVRKDGSLFWANVVISAIRDEEGALVGFSKVTRDMTEYKRAEEAQEARL
ncbi:MAG TPA: PAS domain S-box protein, partial [Polyangia bacterium]|nr:PAS domain S-box protein [Polyangia bacterium]